MTIFLAWLWKNKALAGLLVLAAILGVQTLRVSSLKKDLAVYQAQVKAAQARATAINAASKAISQTVGQSDAAAQAQIAAHGQAVTKEIAVYVPKASSTLVDPGVVRVLDDGLSTGLPSVSGATGGPDGSGAPVTVADALTAGLADIEACRANSQQLTDLQSWITAQKEAFGK